MLLFFRDCDSLFPSAPSLESRPINVPERMPNSSGHYVCSISDDDGSLFISDSSRMDVDENVSLEMDDQEIRMDLTDDLLHLVCIAYYFTSYEFCFVILGAMN